MIRFVYIGDQIVEGGTDFAWFDTVRDRFVEFNGTHAWDSWSDFVDDYFISGNNGSDLGRFMRLFPKNLT